MTRRYFKCPIQALYMMKEFGVKFESINGELLDTNDLETVVYYRHDLNPYVAEESEDIFEPKEGDYAVLANGFLLSTFYKGKWCALPDFRSNKVISDESKIIMRDNKHFFFGELESEQQTIKQND